MQFDDAVGEAYEMGIEVGRRIAADCEHDPADDNFVAEVLAIEENSRQYASFVHGDLQELRELHDSIEDGEPEDMEELWDAYEEGVGDAARNYRERICGEDDGSGVV